MPEQEATEITLAATVENLTAVNEFVASFLEPLHCSPKVQFQIDLVVEEIFVNIASYAYAPGEGMATVKIAALHNPPGVQITFSDEGKPYNPLENADPDLNLPMEERQIGGLGIFLVKKNMDDVKYEYRDGKNIMTVRKNF